MTPITSLFVVLVAYCMLRAYGTASLPLASRAKALTTVTSNNFGFHKSVTVDGVIFTWRDASVNSPYGSQVAFARSAASLSFCFY